MKGFLEQYGVGIFVLVLISILIAFASPIGKTIKNDITTKVNNLEEITDEETEIAKGNYYTIVFDGNGATSGSMKPMKVICGKEFKMPKCEFSKSGANKTNIWSTKRDGSGGVLSKYTKLFPMFITNTYTITYHANATDAVGTTASSHHTYDKSASLTANGFTRSGYMFLGWNTTADGSGTTYTDMQEVKNLTDQNNVNIDLYAMWQKN